MGFNSFIRILAVSGALLLASGTSLTAMAHESRNVGNYRLTVGFFTEPAFEGQKNGIDFRVRQNNAELTPVTGVEKTVQVEITHVLSNTTKVFPIRSIFNDPGHYTNDLILTASGQYQFRYFGTIDGVPVNETFTSGPGTFGDVQSAAEMQFPQQLPQVREINAAVSHMEEEYHGLEESAGRAVMMSIGGTVLGAFGTIVGLVALAASRRKGKAA